MSLWLLAFLIPSELAHAQTRTILSSIKDREQVRKLVIFAQDAVKGATTRPLGTVFAPVPTAQQFNPGMHAQTGAPGAMLPPGGQALGMPGAQVPGFGVAGQPNTHGKPPRVRKVHVISARIYVQNGQCFNDSEPPVGGIPFRLVKGGDFRQIDLEVDEVTGIDPHLGGKLHPGEHFSTPDLQKKYAHELRPLPRLTGAECQALAGPQAGASAAPAAPSSGSAKPHN